MVRNGSQNWSSPWSALSAEQTWGRELAPHHAGAVNVDSFPEDVDSLSRKTWARNARQAAGELGRPGGRVARAIVDTGRGVIRWVHDHEQYSLVYDRDFKNNVVADARRAARVNVGTFAIATGDNEGALRIAVDQPDTEVKGLRGKLVEAWLTDKSRRPAPTRARAAGMRPRR